MEPLCGREVALFRAEVGDVPQRQRHAGGVLRAPRDAERLAVVAERLLTLAAVGVHHAEVVQRGRHPAAATESPARGETALVELLRARRVAELEVDVPEEREQRRAIEGEPRSGDRQRGPHRLDRAAQLARRALRTRQSRKQCDAQVRLLLVVLLAVAAVGVEETQRLAARREHLGRAPGRVERLRETELQLRPRERVAVSRQQVAVDVRGGLGPA